MKEKKHYYPINFDCVSIVFLDVDVLDAITISKDFIGIDLFGNHKTVTVKMENNAEKQNE